MTRKKRSYKRQVVADFKYNSAMITRFINRVMKCGKKSTAESIVYEVLEMLGEKTGKDPLAAFQTIIKNVTPLMEVKSRRVGGSTYQVPIEVKHDRGLSLAMRWIIQNARNGNNGTMVTHLFSEMHDAFNNTGSSIKKKDDTHRMAEANKAFAHFRW
ncbi:MAG: 30S ribosomal protein S7 [Candidatus Margulisbacteria bacterium]|nr:30S ribosomal protein S7 [Candidatus Margulisiibacteriota bacterium]